MPHIMLRQQRPGASSFAWRTESLAARGEGGKTPGSILLINRRDPTSHGGVQRHSARLAEMLRARYHVTVMSWCGPVWAAPLRFNAVRRAVLHSPAQLLLCDDVLTAVLTADAWVGSGKKVVATAHGLEVVTPWHRYQERLADTLSHLDGIVCVSHATAREVLDRGARPACVEIVPNMAETDVPPREPNAALVARIEQLTGMNLRNRAVLLSLGRPTRRKGFDHFAGKILPSLPERCVYVVAGARPRLPLGLGALTRVLGARNRQLVLQALGFDSIHDELVRCSRHPRVFYINGVSEDLRNLLFSAADLFIMPNRIVPHDMEGFGIVALEAAVRGVPVVATGIEGIPDAVVDGHNGWCVPADDDRAMTSRIRALLDESEHLRAFGAEAARFTTQQFAPQAVADRYADLFDRLLETPVFP